MNTHAQKRSREFELHYPHYKIKNSLYKTIKLIDNSPDQSYVGIVQVGVFNAKARVVPKEPLSIQVAELLDSLTTETANNGELLIQVREFKFAEVTSAMSESGFCYFRANLYVKKDTNYYPLKFIDTVVIVKSLDVTKALLRDAGKTVSGFIESALLRSPDTSVVYAMNNITTIDTYEKSTMPVFVNEHFKDGIYEDFRSFRDQFPTWPVTARLKNGKLSSVKAIQKNESIYVERENIYAVVFQGQAFISTDFGYYLLTKQNNNLVFKGRARVTASSTRIIAASVAFGMLGGMIASNASSWFEMRIDHLNGGFIRVRELGED